MKKKGGMFRLAIYTFKGWLVLVGITLILSFAIPVVRELFFPNKGLPYTTRIKKNVEEVKKTRDGSKLGFVLSIVVLLVALIVSVIIFQKVQAQVENVPENVENVYGMIENCTYCIQGVVG
jgi:uncharacterized protein YpmB